MEELVFKYFEHRPLIDHPIEAMTRHRDGAMVLIRDGMNRWILARKEGTYPEGMAKMVGGGIEPNEGPAEAAARELHQETGIIFDPERFVPLVHADVFESATTDKPSFSTFIFYAMIEHPLTAASDVTGFLYLSDREAQQLIQRICDLPNLTPINDQSPATWHDWGLVWGPIHQAAFERIKELGI